MQNSSCLKTTPALRLFTGVFPLLSISLGGVACQSTDNSRTAQQSAPLAAPSSSEPTASPSPSARGQLSFAPVTQKEIEQPEQRILNPHPISVSLTPYCEPRKQAPGSLDAAPQDTWAIPGEEHAALFRQFSSHPQFISAFPEEKRRIIVLLFEPTFTDWASIQEQIPVPRQAQVELRPSCFTSAQRDAAWALLRTLPSDSSRPSIHAVQPEAGINGFRVYVLPDHPEEEKETARLKEQFGGIVNIWRSHTSPSLTGSK